MPITARTAGKSGITAATLTSHAERPDLPPEFELFKIALVRGTVDGDSVELRPIYLQQRSLWREPIEPHPQAKYGIELRNREGMVLAHNAVIPYKWSHGDSHRLHRPLASARGTERAAEEDLLFGVEQRDDLASMVDGPPALPTAGGDYATGGILQRAAF